MKIPAMSNQAWRKNAYLKKDNWPEAIPPMAPRREYGPYPWGQKHHHDPHDVDDYPSSHPDAGSIGHEYLGDVCPQCGVPLSWEEEVVTIQGNQGYFYDVNDLDSPTPAFHPECWKTRKAKINSIENYSIDDFHP